DFAFRAELLRERLRVALERTREPLRSLMDVGLGETREVVDGDARARRYETTVRGDDEDALRSRERVRVGELSSEVEPREEAHHRADLRSVARTERARRRERCRGVEEHARTFTVEPRW